MFRVIHPNQHCFYRARIDLLVGLMKLRSHIPLVDEELSQATFIIAEQNAGNVYGGAILRKNLFSDFPCAVKKSLSIVHPFSPEVWQAIPFLFHEHAFIASSKDRGWIIKAFYSGLFEHIIKFGLEEKVEVLCFSLTPCDYNSIKGKDFSPYDLNLDPQISSEVLFHGVLSFQQPQYGPPKTPYKSIGLSSDVRRALA